MKKLIVGMVMVTIMMPSVSFANTSEIETKKIALMKELIVLLEQRVQQLELLVAEQNNHALNLATSTPLVSGSTEKTKKKRRRGGSSTSSRSNEEKSTENTIEEVATTTSTSTDTSTDTNNATSTDNSIDTEIGSTTASSTATTTNTETETTSTTEAGTQNATTTNDNLGTATSTEDNIVTPVIPTCNIFSDKDSYVFNDPVTLSWESTDAIRAYFETDFDGRDIMTPPNNGGDVATSGTAIMPANILGNPTVQLNVVSADGVERSCVVKFEVDYSEPEVDDTTPIDDEVDEELQIMINHLLAQIATLQEEKLDNNTNAENTPQIDTEQQTALESLLSQVLSLVEVKQNGTSNEPDVRLQEMVGTLLTLIENLQEEKPTTAEIDQLIDSVSEQINEVMQEMNNNPSPEREKELQVILDSLLALMAILHEETPENNTPQVNKGEPTDEEYRRMIDSLLAQISSLSEEKYNIDTSAETTEDLQVIINSLLAQIATLQKDWNHSGTTAPCPYSWTRDLNIGSEGPDVLKLQQLLNSDPDTRIAVNGEGSIGNETDIYTEIVSLAVAKFQVKYRKDTLTPIGEVNPSGVFNAITRAKANSLCSPPFDPNSEKG